MTRINAIQRAISYLNGGQFQKIMDAYFFKMYDVYSIGSVFGDNNPRKGTPDALVKSEDNRYILIEYTVQKDNLVNKLIDDIDSCLDESKTNIKKEQIEKIICCTKHTLTTKDIEKLNTKADDENFVLELFTGDLISRKLLSHPTIVKEYLDIEIDTGQILDIKDFVRLYNNGKLATSLNNVLYGREQEVEEIIKAIDDNSVTVLAGAPGIGKTRIALDSIKKYNNLHKEYIVKCFRNNGLNFYEDLEMLFERENKYILFIDDVNQLTQLNLILDSLNRDDIKLKIILTVRDYALEKLIDNLGALKVTTIEITKLDDSIITTICDKEYGIKNQHYTDRIIEIAKGNPRLVVMACEIAIEQEGLSNLYNPSTLLNEYYRSVKRDFEEDFRSKDILKTAAIIAFLGSVNLKDSDNIELISKSFNISKESIEVGIERLHNMEIIDVYKNYVVKVSDQILNTFIFHYTVFEKEYLRYSDFIKAYFPRIKHRIIEHLNSVMFYYHKESYESVVSELKKVYSEVKEIENYNEQFIQTFWFALDVEPLTYANNKIKEMEYEEAERLDFDVSKSFFGNVDLLDLLGNFSNTKYKQESLDLTFNYLEKNPTKFRNVYDSLIRNYGYRKESSLNSYKKQVFFLEELTSRFLTSGDFIKQMMVLKISQYFLRFNYDYAEAKGTSGATFISFSIDDNDTVLKVRELAWNTLVYINNIPQFKKEISRALIEYGKQNSRNKEIKTVISADKAFVLRVLGSTREMNLTISISFGETNNLFSNYDLEFDEHTKKLYETEKYIIYKTMTENLFRKAEFQEIPSLRMNNLKKVIDLNSIKDFENIFELTKEVLKNDLVTDNFTFQQSLSLVLELPYPSIKEDVLKRYFSFNLAANINPYPILRSYSKEISLKKIEEIILTADFASKDHWLYSIYHLEAHEDIDHRILEKIYLLFNSSDMEWLSVIDIDLFTKFLPLDSEVFVKITKYLLKKDSELALVGLKGLINPYRISAEDLMELYKTDMGVLKETYLTLFKLDESLDYDGSYFKALIQKDRSILDELFKTMVSDNLFSHHDNKHFQALWEIDDWEEIINRYFEILHQYDENHYINTYISNIFLIDKKKRTDKIIQRQKKWIEDIILKYHNDNNRILLLFKAVSNLDYESRIGPIKLLVEKNDSFSLFKMLAFEPLGFSWSGSEIPLLKRRRDFYIKLENELIGVKYLKHKEFLNEMIDSFNERIEKEMVKEFMEDI